MQSLKLVAPTQVASGSTYSCNQTLGPHHLVDKMQVYPNCWIILHLWVGNFDKLKLESPKKWQNMMEGSWQVAVQHDWNRSHFVRRCWMVGIFSKHVGPIVIQLAQVHKDIQKSFIQQCLGLKITLGTK